MWHTAILPWPAENTHASKAEGEADCKGGPPGQLLIFHIALTWLTDSPYLARKELLGRQCSRWPYLQQILLTCRACSCRDSRQARRNACITDIYFKTLGNKKIETTRPSVTVPGRCGSSELLLSPPAPHCYGTLPSSLLVIDPFILVEVKSCPVEAPWPPVPPDSVWATLSQLPLHSCIYVLPITLSPSS